MEDSIDQRSSSVSGSTEEKKKCHSNQRCSGCKKESKKKTKKLKPREGPTKTGNMAKEIFFKNIKCFW
jgi:hypothetical protein